MISKDKVSKIFCVIDEFSKSLTVELDKNCVCHKMGVKKTH